LLTPSHILVVDEAGMIGARQMERIVREAETRGAKLVLVGDPEQLQAIEAGAAFRSINERHGGVEITEVRRQREDWQRDATRQLATGRTEQAIRAYDETGHIHAAETREAARADLVSRWDRNLNIPARRSDRGELQQMVHLGLLLKSAGSLSDLDVQNLSIDRYDDEVDSRGRSQGIPEAIGGSDPQLDPLRHAQLPVGPVSRLRPFGCRRPT
jgi:hypothetical protein